jgi:hypothetical protein
MIVAGTKECLRRFLLTSSCDPRILARSPLPPQRTARITTHRMSSTASIHNQHIRRELLAYGLILFGFDALMENVMSH